MAMASHALGSVYHICQTLTSDDIVEGFTPAYLGRIGFFDFGFIKAIKPYNVFVLLLCFSELLCLTAWDYYYPVPMAIGATVFGALCICTMLFAKKGVKKWTI